MSRLEIGAAEPDARATAVLRRSRLAARNQGDLQSAALSAGYYAKKQSRTMYIYLGNSNMHAVWRVSDKPSEYLNPINNTGAIVYSVTPELECHKHAVIRPDEGEGALTPNAEYYLWVLREPQKTPEGPLDRRTAINDARMAAENGRYDTAVSIGRDPSSSSFEVIRHFEARTGERLK